MYILHAEESHALAMLRPRMLRVRWTCWIKFMIASITTYGCFCNQFIILFVAAWHQYSTSDAICSPHCAVCGESRVSGGERWRSEAAGTDGRSWCMIPGGWACLKRGAVQVIRRRRLFKQRNEPERTLPPPSTPPIPNLPPQHLSHHLMFKSCEATYWDTVSLKVPTTQTWVKVKTPCWNSFWGKSERHLHNWPQNKYK